MTVGLFAFEQDALIDVPRGDLYILVWACRSKVVISGVSLLVTYFLPKL